ncbi:hypothetical protein GBF38_017998, partial [Nibea albiflora]
VGSSPGLGSMQLCAPPPLCRDERLPPRGSLYWPVRAMEPWLTWVDCLGWQPNHLAPSQTPAGPKLRKHNRWALKGPTASALLQEDEEEDEGEGKRDRN